MSGALSERIRTNVREVLEMIGDPRAQRAYERDVPIANVPAELVSLWFDDHYHPSDTHFLEAFTAKELVDLASFNDFYNAQVRSLPTTSGLRALQGTAGWAEIVDRANATLASLGWATGD